LYPKVLLETVFYFLFFIFIFFYFFVKLLLIGLLLVLLVLLLLLLLVLLRLGLNHGFGFGFLGGLLRGLLRVLLGTGVRLRFALKFLNNLLRGLLGNFLGLGLLRLRLLDGLDLRLAGDDVRSILLVPPAKPATINFHRCSNSTGGTLAGATVAVVLLLHLLLLLGFVPRRDVLLGVVPLKVPPDAVHDLGLVPTDTKTLLLAELVESPGSAVAKVIAGLALRRVLDLVLLGNLGRCTLGRFVIRDGLTLNNLEVVCPAPAHEVTESIAKHLGVREIILVDEKVDAVVDRRHLQKKFEKV